MTGPSLPRGRSRIFRSPSDQRLRLGWRLLIHLIILFLLVVLISPGVFYILIAGHEVDQDLTLLANGIGLAIPMTISVYLARTRLDRRSVSSLGLRLSRQARLDFLVGFGLPALLMGLIYLIEWAAGWLHFEAFAWQSQPISRILLGILISLVAFLLTGWGEELLFRGYWLQNLAEGLNWFWAAMISSTLFALAHSLNPGVSWVAILGLVIAGFLFVFCFTRTGLLWLPIGFHLGWNFFEGSVFGFQVSGLKTYPLIEQTVSGPALVTGGAFGPEAGLIILPALGLGAFLIFLYTRSRKPS